MLRFLKVQFQALTDDFNNSIKGAAKEAKEFEKTIRPTKELLKEVGTASVAAGLAVVGAMTGMAKAAANYGDELLDASKRTGASVQELARLKFAAEQSGASFGDVSTGLRVLARNLNEAAQGTAAQSKAFQTLGISVSDSTGKIRPMNEVLLDVADRFKGMEDGAEKAAIAQEIFGRGGAALIPVLNEGREGLKAMGDQAQRLGLVIGRDAAAAGDAFNDTLEEIKGATLGLANSIGSVILPLLTSMAQKARDGIVAFKDFTSEHEFLTKAIFAAGAALTGVGGLLLGLTAVLSIAPSVANALTLVSKAAQAVAASALAAQLGVAALGAALGIGVGLLINWAIEGTKVRQVMDDIGEKSGKAFFELTGGNQKLALETSRLNEKLREQGLAVDRGAMSLGEWNVAVINAFKNSNQFTTALEKGKQAATAHAQATKISAEEIDFFFRISQGSAKNTGQVLNELAEKSKAAAQQQKADWKELATRQENLSESTQAVIAATIQARKDLANSEFERIKKEADANRAHSTAMIQIWEDMASERERIENENFKEFEKIRKSQRDLELHSIDVINDAEKQAAEDQKRRVEDQKRALERAQQDIKRSAGAIFDAMLIKGEGVFKSLGNALKGGALSLGRSIFEDVTAALLGPVKKAFDDFIGGILGKITGSLGNKLAGALGIGGTAASSATGAIGTAGSAAGSIGGAGSAASGAGSLTAGLIGAAGGIIGGGLSALATMRTEGTLNAIEFNTRATRIHAEVMINELLHPIRNFTEFTAEQQAVHATQLDAIFNALTGRTASSTNVYQTGRVFAEQAAAAGAPTQPIVINSTFAPVINLPPTTDRDAIMTTLVDSLDINYRGYLGELVQLIRGAAPGVVAGVA